MTETPVETLEEGASPRRRRSSAGQQAVRVEADAILAEYAALRAEILAFNREQASTIRLMVVVSGTAVGLFLNVVASYPAAGPTLLAIASLLMAALSIKNEDWAAFVIWQSLYVEQKLRRRYLQLMGDPSGAASSSPIFGWDEYLRSWMNRRNLPWHWQLLAAFSLVASRIVNLAFPLIGLVGALFAHNYYYPTVERTFEGVFWIVFGITSGLVAITTLGLLSMLGVPNRFSGNQPELGDTGTQSHGPSTVTIVKTRSSTRSKRGQELGSGQSTQPRSRPVDNLP